MMLSRSTCFSKAFPGCPVQPARFRHSAPRSTRPVCRAESSPSANPAETPEQALQRRLRESERVEQRVIDVTTEEELQHQLQAAGNKLVVIEIQADTVCETGFPEEAELHWQQDRKAEHAARMAQCASIKHVFQRTARDCSDVQFLSVRAADDGICALCEKLGVEVLPTLQFYRNGFKLWEHRGLMQAEQDLGEGVLFYGDSAGKGVRGSDFVQELHTPQEMQNFIAGQPPNILTVINIALLSATPCVRIFPAVVALAKNFKGHAVFARLIGDSSVSSDAAGVQQLMKDYNVVEVPTFLFFRNGKEVGRHVGSSRGDLIGQILQQQAAAGIKPPPPPPGAGRKVSFRAPPKKASWR